MADLFPVYRQIADMLTQDPSQAYQMDIDQLNPIIQLSESAQDVLLPSDVLKQVKQIMEERETVKKKVSLASKPKPNLILKPKGKTTKLVIKPKISQKPKADTAAMKPLALKPPVNKANIPMSIVTLNGDHTLAVNMTTQQLQDILEWSDDKYYNGITEDDQGNTLDLLDDKVYDYIKRIYGSRVHKTNDPNVTMKSLSKTGVGSKISRDRDVKLPYFMGSLDDLFMGENHVAPWVAGHPGPYHVSAKMDGISALYHDGFLYTRGDGYKGRDISHFLKYFNLPDVNYTVRGELVMDKHVFDEKYKGKKSKHGGVRKVNRNSVAGAMGSINHIDEQFVSDIQFVAYQIINDGTQDPPSEQFTRLEADGFVTAKHFTLTDGELTEELLSEYYQDWHENYNFVIDGLVMRVDQAYVRATGKNPDYAKAFKEALDQDTAVTTIDYVKWEPTQYTYLKPVAVLDPPAVIRGVSITNVTIHNAAYVQRLGVGPGAVVEIEYRALCNPQIHKVLTPVEPQFPDVDYVWTVNDQGRQVNIKLLNDKLDESEEDNVIHTVRIKKIYRFLVEIGAKGLGETTVKKIYDSSPDLRTVGGFINMTSSDIGFLGKTNCVKFVQSIKDALNSATMPMLMGASKTFGMGLNKKKFEKVFEKYPDFASQRLKEEEYIAQFKTVEGFADKTAILAAKGMDTFWKFVDQYIPDNVLVTIMDNTSLSLDSAPAAGANPAIEGKNICITGFRDSEISEFITRNGGKVQSAVNGKTNMVVIRDDSYTNKKTEAANAKNIPILSKEDFLREYML